MAAKLAGERTRFSLGQNSDINVTPFVDVMLVLLIIFMVAAPMATSAIKVNQPPPGAPTIGLPPTFISISDNGSVWLSSGPTRIIPTSLPRLVSDLTAALHSPAPRGERIFVRAESHVRYEQFMSVLNTLQQAGLYSIGLINEAPVAGRV